jgi:hypothetical protein
MLLDYDRPAGLELDGGESEALRSHLVGCPACAALARAGRRLDERVGAAVRAVGVPAGLRDRLLGRLREDRRAGHRRRGLRRAAAVAAAAVVLLAVWLVFLRSQRPPAPNLDDLASLEVKHEATPDSVEEWFRDTYKVHTVVPRQFNYALLTNYDLANFPVHAAEPVAFLRPSNKRVPFLLFIKADAAGVHSARVYILSDKEFDLRDVADGPRAGSGGSKVEVRRDPDNPHVVYVIVYTGPTLEPFLADRPRPAA